MTRCAMSMTAPKPRIASVSLVLGLFLSALAGFGVLGQRSVVALDYRAFYCAGMSLRFHANPYHATFLRSCEIHSTDPEYGNRLKGAALPAPQPLYDIALFSAFSTLPFAVSKALWGAVLGIAIFCSTVSLIRLTGLSPPLVFGILGVSVVADALALGQIIPIYTAAAFSAALLAKEKKFEWAGAAASLTMIEPHLGLPVCAALALWAPRARLPLTVGAVILGVVAFIAGGLSVNAEYVTTVLPLHALSEVASDGQLSLSVILHAVGIPSMRAIQFGTLSYLAMSAFGIVAGRSMSVRYDNWAYCVAVPAACAVVGGSFLHGTEVVAAIPFALLMVGTPPFRSAGVLALILIGTPWSGESHPEAMVAWFGVSAAVVAYILRQCANFKMHYAALCGIFVFAVLCVTNFSYAQSQRAYMQQPHQIAVVIDDTYPQADWAGINAGSLFTQSVPSWLIRTPTWAGLLLLVSVAAVASTRQRAYFLTA